MNRNKSYQSNININNFGVIGNADIDVVPLTVFIGPNSSGKSFIAKLIQCFSLPHESTIVEKGFIHLLNSSKNFNESNLNLFNEFDMRFKEYLNSNPTLNSDPFVINFKEFRPLIEEVILKHLADVFKEEIMEQFEMDLDDLINFNKDFFEIRINNNIFKKERDKPFSLPVNTLFLRSNSRNGSNDENAVLHLYFDEESNIYIQMESSVVDKEESFITIYGLIGSIIFENLLLENSYYIPAERSELIMDKRLLIRKIQNKSDLSKNQSDVLANIINIDKADKGDFFDLSCQFEKEFSGIFADVEDNGILNEIVYRSSQFDRQISSKILSTSISEMSIFSLYLKYILKKGDLLIIEEPEAHLHPANQRLLVKYFVKAINQGLKILITTHSDYIISQIDNMINLNNVSEADLSSLNYTKDHILNFEDVNIYNFKKNQDNSYDAEKIDIDEDGFMEDNFSKIADELYEESIFIRNSSF